MTRPTKSSLVLDGSAIKLRLLAERAETKTPVHVDWVRFTTLCRNQPTIPADRIFPLHSDFVADYEKSKNSSLEAHYFASNPGADQNDFLRQQHRRHLIEVALNETPDEDFFPAAQALSLAEKTCEALGPDYSVNPAIGKGHDFYKCRWIIQRNDAECGWVGFLSSGDSPKQKAQSQTLHVNIFGAACTFAKTGWNHRIADLIDEVDAKLTRADLALDFFDGFPGGIMAIFEGYRAGACDVGGRRLKSSCLGDWANKNSRSFYFGSREAGKITNCYEKGDQLFGPGVTGWLRAELRYGNKLRVLPSDILRRPANFFADASDWHAHALSLADVCVTPEKIATTPRLPALTVEAEAFKNIKWALNTAAPTMAALWTHLGDDFLEFVTNKALPGRLRNFAPSELARAFTSAKCRLFSQPESAPAFVPA